MPLSSETRRAVDYLRGIIESGRVLKLGEPRALNGNNSYLFTVTAFDKEWDLFLTRENLDDTPGTKEHRESADELARTLDLRFRNADPNLFLTVAGRPLKITPDWPPLPLLSPDLRSYIAASGLKVLVTDFNSGEIARCIVVMTSLQTMPGTNPGPYKRYEAIINSIRSEVDRSKISFYKSSEQHPNTLQTVDLDYSAKSPMTKLPNIFIQEKVWRCGFQIGGQDQGVWTADPWDATYLSCTLSSLQQESTILNAQEKIVLAEGTYFARVGKVLLQQEGPATPKQSPISRGFRTALAEYTLGGLLGEGGSGRVFRATNENSIEYAIKYLNPRSLNTAKLKRFRNELSFCMGNIHPNVIRVVDWGLTEIDNQEVPFYVMPIFPMTLRKVMNQPTEPAALLEIFEQIINGVEAAHQQSIWHRDLKPQNILYDADAKRAVVTDFGIAHFSEALLHTLVDTHRQDRLANFQYAAPEQRTNGVVDHRADIYALGLILYEMLTGELLQGTQHRRIASVVPELAYLDSVVDMMSRQSPQERPQSISEIREIMNRERPALQSVSVHAFPEPNAASKEPSASPTNKDHLEIKSTDQYSILVTKFDSGGTRGIQLQIENDRPTSVHQTRVILSSAASWDSRNEVYREPSLNARTFNRPDAIGPSSSGKPIPLIWKPADSANLVTGENNTRDPLIWPNRDKAGIERWKLSLRVQTFVRPTNSREPSAPLRELLIEIILLWNRALNEFSIEMPEEEIVPPTLPGAFPLDGKDGAHREVASYIMCGPDQLLAYKTTREGLAGTRFLVVRMRPNGDQQSVETPDRENANSKWSEWYQEWKQKGFGGASGSGLDGMPPF